MRIVAKVLTAILVLPAGCLSGAQDVATGLQESLSSEDPALIEWVENASRTADDYENLTRQAVETHERYWNDELAKQEANETLKSTAGALWNLSQDWEHASLYNDSQAVQSVHTDLEYAGINYALGVAGLWSGIVNEDYSQATDGMETINETHQSLREARETLDQIDPR